MVTKYAQGRDTEYLAQRTLLADGWQSVRSAGSKKAADIIAYCEKGTRFIQCKRYTDRPGMFTKDIGQLMSIDLPPNASSELWVRQAGQTGWLERTLIKHTYGGTMDVHSLDDLGKEKAFTTPINPDAVTDIANTMSSAAKAQRWKQKQSSSRTRGTPEKTRSSSNSPTTGTPDATATVAQPSEQDRAGRA